MSNETMSEEEREYYAIFERAWRASLPRHTFYTLLELFPHAKPAIKRNLLAEIDEAQKDLVEARRVDSAFNNEILSRAQYQERELFIILRDKFVSGPLRKNREKLIKKNRFYLSALKPKKVNSADSYYGIGEAEVLRAKEVPIDSLIEVGRNGFATCPFHTDRTASLRVYLDTNRWYCFSCNAGTDVIDLVMKFHQVKFAEAVKMLLKK